MKRLLATGRAAAALGLCMFMAAAPPGLLAQEPPFELAPDSKPLRVFLQGGTRDLDLRFGNWWLANQQMASSLEFAGYDFRTAWGEGGHNLEHGGAVFPDTMRWLWRDASASP